jgi:hypothetical protein
MLELDGHSRFLSYLTGIRLRWAGNHDNRGSRNPEEDVALAKIVKIGQNWS